MHINQSVFSNTPHERGALGKPTVLLDSLGIIPACAGSTPRAPPCRCSSWDHPRMRGEHCLSRNRFCRTAGSSPHVWGALRGARPGRGADGIIPACAGSTRRPPPRKTRAGDHPRMRGEHGVAFGRPRLFAGSSPHARGARLEGAVHHVLAGIIPACAGSTRDKGAFAARGWDHPRMRGEHPTRSRRRARPAGSSPHARGAPDCQYCPHAVVGIIPACAGSTSRRRWPRRCSGDHPRMRGEHRSPVLQAL